MKSHVSSRHRKKSCTTIIIIIIFQHLPILHQVKSLIAFLGGLEVRVLLYSAGFSFNLHLFTMVPAMPTCIIARRGQQVGN